MYVKINLFAALFAIILYGCKKENRFDLIKRTGAPGSTMRNLDFFNVIEVNNNMHIFLVQDTVCYVEIKAGKNLISNIETKVENNILTVKNNNKYNFTRSYKSKLELYIHFSKLNELIYHGTGPISSVNSITNDTFTFNCWDGVDTVKLKLEVSTMFANIHTGTADLIATGNTGQLYAYARSSGTFRMDNFKCKNVYTNNISSSDHYFYAENKLEALVQYVGNTYCSGNPLEVIKTENNKGKLFLIE